MDDGAALTQMPALQQHSSTDIKFFMLSRTYLAFQHFQRRIPDERCCSLHLCPSLVETPYRDAFVGHFMHGWLDTP
jgi:hypothetical protein